MSVLARSRALTTLAVLVMASVAVAVGLALRLTLAGSVGLYFVVWWTVLFTILPVRIRSQAEAGTTIPGTDPGAPSEPALAVRILWTTVAADLVFALVAILFPLAGL